jgi:hypothetical protein
MVVFEHHPFLPRLDHRLQIRISEPPKCVETLSSGFAYCYNATTCWALSRRNDYSRNFEIISRKRIGQP